MRLEELLNSLSRLAKENDLTIPYIVGGLPRDKIMGIPAKEVKDIDITTGDQNSFTLALVCDKEWPQAKFRTYDDKLFINMVCYLIYLIGNNIAHC